MGKKVQISHLLALMKKCDDFHQILCTCEHRYYTYIHLQGILQPENIAIHVAQNAVNFLSSSLAWLAIGAFASQTSLSGRGIDQEIISAAAAASATKSAGKLQPILLSPTSHSGHAGHASPHRQVHHIQLLSTFNLKKN